MNPERGTGKTLTVPSAVEGGSFGFGVRVIAGGAWGFSCSPFVNVAEIVRITGEAVAVAKANSVLQVSPVELAPAWARGRKFSNAAGSGGRGIDQRFDDADADADADAGKEEIK